MKTVILLLNDSHFSQVLSILKRTKLKKQDITILTLGPYSLKRALDCGYSFISPNNGLKETIRESVFKNLLIKINEWGLAEINNGQTLRSFLRLNNVDLWDLIKDRLGIELFNRVYFIELVHQMLIGLSPDSVIVPTFPRRIPIYYSTFIRRKTVVKLVEGLNIKVEDFPYPLSGAIIYSMRYFKNGFLCILSRIINSFKLRNIVKFLRFQIKKLSLAQLNTGGKKKILFWGKLTDCDFRSIIHVFSNLISKGFECKMVIDRHTFSKFSDLFMKESVNLVSVKSYKRGINKSFLLKILGGYNEKWRILKRQSSAGKRLFMYHNISFWNDEHEEIFSFLKPYEIKNIFRYYSLLTYALEIEKPICLVFPDNQSIIGKICAQAAKDKNISYLCIPDAVDQLNDNIFLSDLKEDSLYALIGRAVLEKLKEKNISSSDNKIVVTGSAQLDSYHKVSVKYKKEEILNRFRIKDGSGIFLFTMQSGLPEEKELLNMLVSAMQYFPGKYLIIRPHPGDRTSNNRIHSVFSGRKNIIFSNDFDFVSVASIAELIFTVYSLTGFEAMLLDKPVINLNLTCYPDSMPYARYSASLGVYREEDLVPTIKKALVDPLTKEKLKEGRKRIIEDYAYKLDGKATERISCLLEQAAQNING